MAKKLKLREKMVIIAERLSGVEVDGRSKYRTFKRIDKDGYFFFVGNAGALRTGTSASKSYNIATMPTVKKMLAELD